ncbi:MAG: hypothetical protein OXT67_02305 [Zetaproteobacteria bacterium]|nr:hypothetical protein [Zetaproteobacteria bacterium]
MLAQRHKLHYSRWLLCLCLCWGSTLHAHPLGDFFHQYGRKILIGVGTALGVTSTVAVGASAYLAYELRHVSRAVPSLTPNSETKMCTAPQGDRPCNLCQQHSPGQVCWNSHRSLLESPLYYEMSEQLEYHEDKSPPLTTLFELLLHNQIDPFQIIRYLPRKVEVSHEQVASLLASPRYAPLRQKCPGLAQALDAHFKL